MTRDYGVPVVLGLLVPAALLGLLSFVLAVTAFAALVVFPWIGPHGVRGVGRVGTLAVVTAPFVVFALLDAPRLPGVTLLPAPAWWLALAGGVTLAALPPAKAVPLGVVVLSLLGLDGVLGAADRPLLPRTWVAAAGPVLVLDPVPTSGTSPSEQGEEPGAGLGWRPGDALAVEETALGRGAGRWYVPAARGRFPVGSPLVAVFGAPLPAGAAEGMEVVSAAELDPGDPLVLDAFGGVVLLPGGWPAGLGEPAAWADVLATYARRGGLLVGPAPDRPWPEGIGRRLGRAGTSHEGRGVRPYGLGRIARPASAQGVREVLGAEARGPRLGTVFDGGRSPLPGGDRVLERAPGPRGDRRAPVLLLALYALVAVALDRILRHGWPRLLGAVGPALAVIAGILWSSPGEAGLRARGVAFDLGGGGGRRVEAVLLAAGEAGWRGRVRWEGGGLVRLEGGRLDPDGRVHLLPGERAWVIRESVAEGGFTHERESPGEGFLLGFLRGPVEAARVRLGEVDGLAIEIEGVARPGASTLTIP